MAKRITLRAFLYACPAYGLTLDAEIEILQNEEDQFVGATGIGNGGDNTINLYSEE